MGMKIIKKWVRVNSVRTGVSLLTNPKEFYHEVHRPSHFLNFASLEEGSDWNGADREDMFA